MGRYAYGNNVNISKFMEFILYTHTSTVGRKVDFFKLTNNHKYWQLFTCSGMKEKISTRFFYFFFYFEYSAHGYATVVPESTNSRSWYEGKVHTYFWLSHITN